MHGMITAAECKKKKKRKREKFGSGQSFLLFSLPHVRDHNSDKFRYHSIGISTSSSVNSY